MDDAVQDWSADARLRGFPCRVRAVRSLGCPYHRGPSCHGRPLRLPPHSPSSLVGGSNSTLRWGHKASEGASTTSWTRVPIPIPSVPTLHGPLTKYLEEIGEIME